MRVLRMLVLTLGALLLLCSCIRWEWNECRQVGHGALYCATHMGNGN